ncbi:hypothetical protein HPT27_03505 [Permianibacter sp. IMCC34836]|uniref:hypothetical protein n=1 Tax=Permianibacter fluminis TaxID=2738515 RepID=UPI001554F365|nr:hypothetical protein [Permianibacter fluminis]NQD36076.1 hypothetical protein [Permianibacter fluminis]
MSDTQQVDKPWWKDHSWIAALGAVLLGVSGVSVSLYQAKLMHEQQRMSAWPYLTVINDNSDLAGKGLSRIVIANDGVGPALIRHVSLWLDGKPLPSWHAMFQQFKPGRQDDIPYSTVHNRVLPFGKTIDAIVLATPEDITALRANAKRIRFDLCYCSVYDDCFLLQSGAEDITTAVAQCPAATDPPFVN